MQVVHKAAGRFQHGLCCGRVPLAGRPHAGIEVCGAFGNPNYFLLNLGLAQRMEQASLAERTQAARLLNEHEMGELFKVIGLAIGGGDWLAQGFEAGDRTHRL